MTRDEAVAQLSGRFAPYQGVANVSQALTQFPAQWIDAFVALGMLKLDEPKSAEEKFVELSIQQGRTDSYAMNVLQVLELAGLKIVEK